MLTEQTYTELLLAVHELYDTRGSSVQAREKIVSLTAPILDRCDGRLRHLHNVCARPAGPLMSRELAAIVRPVRSFMRYSTTLPDGSVHVGAELDAPITPRQRMVLDFWGKTKTRSLDFRTWIDTKHAIPSDELAAWSLWKILNDDRGGRSSGKRVQPDVGSGPKYLQMLTALDAETLEDLRYGLDEDRKEEVRLVFPEVWAARKSQNKKRVPVAPSKAVQRVPPAPPVVGESISLDGPKGSRWTWVVFALLGTLVVGLLAVLRRS